MAIGFNTGIAGITAGTIGSDFSKPKQKTIVSGVKTKPQAPTNLLASRNSGISTDSVMKSFQDEDNTVLAAIDLITQNKTGDNLLSAYEGKLSQEGRDNVFNISAGVNRGMTKEQLKQKFSSVSPDVIDDIYAAKESLTKEDSGVVKDFVTGVASQIPKMFGNILKSVITEGPVAISDPLYMVNKIRGYAGKDDIVFGPFGRGKQVANEITKLGKEAQQEVTDRIGGDKEDIGYKAGQIVAEIAPFFITKKVGGEEVGGAITKKLIDYTTTNFPKLAKFVTNPTVQKILYKGGASIPSTEATTILSEGRGATPQELLMGAGINQIFPAKKYKSFQINSALDDIQSGKLGKELLNNPVIKKVWNAIQPKQTQKIISGKGGNILKGEGGEAIIGRQGGSLFKRPYTVPTKSDIDKIRVSIEAGINPKDGLEKQGLTIAKYIQKNANEADNIINTNNVGVTNKDIISKFSSLEDAPSDITPINKKKIQNIFLKIFEKNTKDTKGLHKTRQEFYKDNSIEKILNGAPTDMQEYVKSIGGASREIISEKIPVYSKIMKNESNAYSVLDNIKTKFDNMNDLQRFLNKHESLLKAIGYSAGFGYAGYEGVQALAGK